VGALKLDKRSSVLNTLPGSKPAGAALSGVLEGTGVPQFLSPGKTDGRTLGKQILYNQSTHLAATPATLSEILAKASPADLASLRWIVLPGGKLDDVTREALSKKAPAAVVIDLPMEGISR
jgi:hypothetical protein